MFSIRLESLYNLLLANSICLFNPQPAKVPLLPGKKAGDSPDVICQSLFLTGGTEGCTLHSQENLEDS